MSPARFHRCCRNGGNHRMVESAPHSAYISFIYNNLFIYFFKTMYARGKNKSSFFHTFFIQTDLSQSLPSVVPTFCTLHPNRLVSCHSITPKIFFPPPTFHGNRIRHETYIIPIPKSIFAARSLST